MSEKQDPNAWMLTFSDLITLLLTFFVLLLTMSSMDDKDFKESFGLLTASFSIIEGGGGTLFEPITENLQIPRELRTGQGVSNLDTRGEISKALDDLVEESSFVEADVITTTDSLIMRIIDRDLFRPGSAVLTAEGIDYLTSAAMKLKEIPYPMFPISIEGYADREIENAQSSYRNNLELSAARAFAAHQALFMAMTEDGELVVRPEQYGIAGYGDHFKTVAGETADGEYRTLDIVVDMSGYHKKLRKK